MPQDGNYSCHVIIAGAQAAEYDVQTDIGPDGVPQVRCAIVSETGKTFGVRFKYSCPLGTHRDTMPTNLMVGLLVDGRRVSRLTGTLEPNKTEKLSNAVEDSIKRPLIFSPMHVIAHDAHVPDPDRMATVDNQLAESIGKIVVDFCTGIQKARKPKMAAPAATSEFKQAILSEHQKKAVFVSHSAGFGEPVAYRASTTPYCYVRDKAVKRFIFEYASKDVHELAGRIPMAGAARAVPPSPLSTRASTSSNTRKRRTTAVDADLTEVKAEQLGKVKDEQLSKVKDEIGEGMVKRRRTSAAGGSAPAVADKVVVSLLDSDDDDEASSSTRRRAAGRPLQPTEAKLVVSLLDSDDD